VPGQVKITCRQASCSSHEVTVSYRVFSAAMRSVASVERSLFVVGAPLGTRP